MPGVKRTVFAVNGREYEAPARPVAVVLLDGMGEEYLAVAADHGMMPRLTAMARRGYRGMARAALPTFTNPNNTCVVTGVPPSVHGICGNYFLDPASGEEVMMNSGTFLRCPTILAAAAQAGRKVGVVTAKDKLRTILSAGLRGINFSAERAGTATREVNGVDGLAELVGLPQPEVYSAAASHYVLKAGAALVRHGLADFLYLSLTDYIQHKHEPDEPDALAFLAGIDRILGELDDLGVVLGLTADHGMNAKQGADGSPNVVYLETLLGDVGVASRVILPITDPYVVHHGAFGSYAAVHLAEPARASEVAARLRRVAGITEVLERDEAAWRLELPPDRTADLVVLSGRHVALGRRPEMHDLTHVQRDLRSHGGRYEEMVPLVVSEPLSERGRAMARGDVRNFDVFALVCGGLAQEACG